LRIYYIISLSAILILCMSSSAMAEGYVYPVLYGDAVYGNGADSIDINKTFSVDVMLNPEGRWFTAFSYAILLYRTGNVNLARSPQLDINDDICQMAQYIAFESWDGDLSTGNMYSEGDLFNISCVSLSGYGGSEMIKIVTIYDLEIAGDANTEGEFCIDSGDFDDNTYDWLFHPPLPFYEACWPVKEYIPPPEDTLNIWGRVTGPAVYGETGSDTINVNDLFYVDVLYNNDDFTRTYWNSPFNFYGTGDVAVIDTQFMYATYNFAVLCTESFYGWVEEYEDGVLPERICMHCEGSIPDDNLTWFVVRFGFVLNGDEITTGDFCIEKGDMENDDYDWLFEWPMPEFETVCLPVKQRISSGICGDALDNGAINMLDITYIIDYLYLGGPEPYNIRLADVNGDCLINVIDVTYLIIYLYMDGPEPDCPDEWPCGDKSGTETNDPDFIKIPLKR